MSDGEFELVTLRNGHRAVKHKVHGEVMHPSVGPWAEANTLYVEQAQFDSLQRLCVLDVGLGAAANAVAALTRWQQTGRTRPIEIHSFEIDLQPLRLAVEDAAGFPFLQPWKPQLTQLMEQGEVRGDGLSWKLHLGDALALLSSLSARVTLVFHDPFSPETNPTMWTPEAFRLVRACCSDDAQLFTYSASTRTRASMLLGGFFVGIGDAIGTKQETTVAATKRELLKRPLGPEWLGRWERSSARTPWGISELTPQLERELRGHPQFR